MNTITQNIVDESKIADELQEMEEASIIKWALENKVDHLKEWCYIGENGNLEGPQADKFQQAIRLEDTKVAQSRHPAGLVISTDPLHNICPLVIDKEDEQLMVALEGPSCEDIGLIKFDVLGITMLDKVMGVAQILKDGDVTIK
jgi:DNA polymerase III alpha subunit